MKKHMKKQFLITVAIATITGVVAYYLGVNGGLSGISKAVDQAVESVSPSKKMTAKSLVLLRPTKSEGMGDGRAMVDGPFFGMMLGSDENIGRAIRDYKLDELFGSNANDLLKQIRESVSVAQVSGTDLTEITTTGSSAEQAQQLNYAVLISYENSKREWIEETKAEAMRKYKEKILRQEDIVEDHRTQVHKMSTKLGIPYYGPGQTPPNNTEEKLLDMMKRRVEENKTERDKLETVVNSLRGLDDENLVITLSVSNRPEAAVVKELDARLKRLTQERADLIANSYGLKHPKVKSVTAAIATTKAQLNKTVQQILDKLGNDLVLMNKQIAKQEEAIAAYKDKVGTSAEQRTQFNLVVEKYEKEVKLLDALKNEEVKYKLTFELQLDPIKYMSKGWTPEIAAMMEARKKSGKK